MPRWFANLSERLATHNGVMLMGLAALAALFYTHGNIQTLVVMYSINVFLTFSLSMIGMCRHWFEVRQIKSCSGDAGLFCSLSAQCFAFRFCVCRYTRKFFYGGWVTVASPAAASDYVSLSTVITKKSGPV